MDYEQPPRGPSQGELPRESVGRMSPYRDSSAQLPTYREYPMDGSFMGRWWRELVAICTGIAAVSGLAWFIGKQFFVTRDEWNAQNKIISEMSTQIAQISGTTTETTKTMSDLKSSLENIDRKFYKFELSRRIPKKPQTAPSTGE